MADPQLHVAFFPFMTPGHAIPMLDIVRLFAARRVQTTVLTTPLNALNISKHLNLDQTNNNSNNNDNNTNNLYLAPNIYIIPFPSEEAGLPEGIESQDSATSPEMTQKFFLAMDLLKHPLEDFLQKTKPHALIADVFFPYATSVANKFSIPRFVFHFTGSFAMSMMISLHIHSPHKLVLSDDEEFTVTGLPHEVKLTKSQMQPAYEDHCSAVAKLCDDAGRAFVTSYGVIFNSFYELEPDYVDFCKKVMGKKCWHLGPVSLCSRRNDEKCQRGKSAAISDHACLKWLDSRPLKSVVYVCFGSLTSFSPAQLKEIALALESFGHDFIWVIKESKTNGVTQNIEWLPEGFEQRIERKGLLIKGWAPQVLILEHQAICGFVTHCGWNSILEGISAGMPMVTWPIYAEQFYNEKLVTDVLKIGVKVGSKKWSETTGGTFLTHEQIVAALNRIMDGEEVVEMRRRANQLKEMAYKAVEEGGSSYRNLSSLIQELTSIR